MSRARRLSAFGAAALAAVALAVPAAQATTLPAGFDEPTLVSGLSRPVGVAWAPGGRMFIITKDGLVQSATDNGAGGLTTPTTWLDLRARVSNDGDRGLLGVAVDSDYANNRYVYLLYTYKANTADPEGPQVSQLLRVAVNANGTPGAQTVILGTVTTDPCPTPSNTSDCIASDSRSHSIGTVRSDPADGTLWISSGDGADFNFADPVALRTYDNTSLNGKILHIDRTGKGVADHPFCPGNPLTDNCTKVYAKGFRNPYRFTLRPNGAGPAVGDVGWSSWEELNLVEKGGDYGWPCYEAQSQTPGYRDMDGCNNPSTGEYTKPTKSPTYWYAHTDPSNAIVAGPTYTGTEYPAGYRDTIFVGDYGSGYVWRWNPASPPGQTAIPFTGDTSAFSWVDLVAAPPGLSYAKPGDLIYVSLADFNDAQGWIGRVRYSSGNHFPVARASGSPTSGNTPLTVGFTGSTSSDQDSDTLSYDWDFGDGTAHSTQANPSHQYTTRGQYTARLTVNDGRGLSDSKTVQITAGGPRVTINAPANNSTYRDGASVPLQASAVDPAGQPITNATYSWHVIIHHSTHLHDLGFFSGASTSFTARTDHDADSHYDVTVTATDAGGLTDTKTVSIFPQTVPFTLASTPTGATMTYGGVNGTAPFANTSAIGYVTSISAASTFSSGGTSYVFESWSDGGTRLHNVTIPATATTLTALYDGVPTARISPASKSGPAPLAASFDGTGSSDPESQALTYDWDFGDGSVHSTASKPSHTYARGTYTATLTVNDGHGGTSSTTIPITATNANPTAKATPTSASGTAPLGVSFDGTGSTDPNNDTLTYDWNFGDGSAHSTASKPSHTYARGTYTATLTVNDGQGGTNSTTIPITATNANPTARATPTSASGNAPLTVTFNGSTSSDPEGDTLTYAWDFGDGASQAATPSPAAAHVYARGTYTATLTVNDGHGGTDTATIPINAGNAAPVARATADRTSGNAPLAISFDGTGSSDADNDGLTYDWDFGDGSAHSTAPKPSHTFSAGARTVRLTVNDGHGATGSTTVDVNVSSPPPPPPPPPGSSPAPAGNPGLGAVGGAGAAAPDRKGPNLVVGAMASGLRRGRLAGTVDDPSGVRAVEVAVRAWHRGGTPCRWWSWRRRVLGKPSACSPPVWIRGSMSGRSWSAWLGGPLPRGRYVVLVRAVDRRGFATTRLNPAQRP